MKNGLVGDAAGIILRNTKGYSDLDVAIWMKDLVNNGCSYMCVNGLRYFEEIDMFYKRNELDITMLMMDYEAENGPFRNANAGNLFSVWHCFEGIVARIAKEINIKL